MNRILPVIFKLKKKGNHIVLIRELIKKSRNGEVLSRKELVFLLALEPGSVETYRVMAEAIPLNSTRSRRLCRFEHWC